MKLIQFPGAMHFSRKSILKKERPKFSGEQMVMGPFDFTCHICSTKTTFTGENMIFKRVEFFCSVCGTRHTVTNPAFKD